ncbi:ABC transporter ATP-binding protein [Streptomyces sp. NPDC057367]|uniref:ABC transporter ATP-binding protein n=1 Tax=Streptomyces sp. NPDC057367 TaxID=3346108 RepID=UPI00363D84F1
MVALDDISFSVPQGQILALLGANGAGKTTLTKVLSTLLLPTSGTVRMLGMDVTREERAVRSRISVIFGGDRGLYGQLSAVENLRYFAVLNGVGRKGLLSKVHAALEEVGISHAADRAVETFSKGMRQRLHIAIGIISEPQVLLLDEPTVGLDPIEAQRLREAVAAMRDRGVTVLLTSHHLLDVERLADRVMVLAGGRLTHDMTLTEFSQQAGHAAIVQITGHGSAPDTTELDRAAMDVVSRSEGENGWEVRVRVGSWSPEVFADIAQAFSKTDVTDVKVEQARLEDAFAAVTGQLG